VATDREKIYVAGSGFISQYRLGGGEQWTRLIEGTRIYNIASDRRGNVYVVGQAHEDAYVAKYDGSGEELWARRFGTRGRDVAFGVAADGEGNAYIVGQTEGILPGQTRSGRPDAFVRKYDPTGEEQWTDQFGSPENAGLSGATSVVVDEEGSVLVEGIFPVGRDLEGFLRKYSDTGDVLWTSGFGPGGGYTGTGVAAADTAGNIYVGQFGILRKYASGGSQLWSRPVELDRIEGVAVDAMGNVYVTGLQEGIGLQKDGGFLHKYDPSGVLLENRDLNIAIPQSIAIDMEGNVYLAGIVQSGLLVPASEGQGGAFVAQTVKGKHAP